MEGRAHLSLLSVGWSVGLSVRPRTRLPVLRLADMPGCWLAMYVPFFPATIMATCNRSIAIAAGACFAAPSEEAPIEGTFNSS